MVMGPTPPGTGVRRGFSECFVEGHVADVAVVVAGVDDNRAWFEAVSPDELGLADGCHHDVGACHDLGQAAGVRMAVGDRRVPGE